MALFPRRRSLTASVSVIPPEKRGQKKSKSKDSDWQRDAWDAFHTLGEVRYAARYFGNALSRVRFFIGTREHPGDPIVPIADDAKKDLPIRDLLDRIRGRDGTFQSLVRVYGVQQFVAGEALDVDTLVATPNGFVKMGDLRDDDVVLGGDGRPCRVVKAHPIRTDRECYEVRFDGETRIVADAAHLWPAYSHYERGGLGAFREAVQDRRSATFARDDEIARRRAAGEKGRALADEYGLSPQTICDIAKGRRAGARHADRAAASGPAIRTEDLREDLTFGPKGQPNYAVQTAAIVGVDPVLGVEIDPYVLGYWLGDGTSVQGAITIHTDDQPHVKERVEAAGYGWSVRPGDARGYSVGILGLQAQLGRMGLRGNKHIPAPYLRHAEEARWALLQGLIDSDGHVDKKGVVEFSNINKRLLWDVVELASSLGLKPGRVTDHRVLFRSAGAPVASLPRKVERINAFTERDGWHYVKAVEPVKSRPVRCITVDSSDATFLVTERFIRTHNSYLVGEDGLDGERWEFLSTSEMRVKDAKNQAYMRVDAGGDEVEIDADSVVLRFWQRDPEIRSRVDSPLRPVLDVCESLRTAQHVQTAGDRSRIASAGVMLVPAEADLPRVPTTDVAGVPGIPRLALLDDMLAAMTASMEDPSSAWSVVPLLVEMSEKYIEKVKHITFDREADRTIVARIEHHVRRLAQGLDMPPEKLLGLGTSNHWSAWAISEDFATGHLTPMAQAFAEDMTVGFVRPTLEATGLGTDLDRYAIGFTLADLTVKPAPAENALDMWDRMLLSSVATVEALGYSEDDMPSEEELAERQKQKKAEAPPPPMDPNQAEEPKSPEDQQRGEQGPPPEGPQDDKEVPAGGPPEQEKAGRLVGMIEMTVDMIAADVGAAARAAAARIPAVLESLQGRDLADIPAYLGTEGFDGLGVTVEDLFSDAWTATAGSLRNRILTKGFDVEVTDRVMATVEILARRRLEEPFTSDLVETARILSTAAVLVPAA